VNENESVEPLYSELCSSKNPAFPRLIKKFIVSLPSYLAKIEDAMLQGNNEVLKSVFHQVKGVSGNYGYPLLYGECEKAEKACLKDQIGLQVIVENIKIISERIMLANK